MCGAHDQTRDDGNYVSVASSTSTDCQLVVRGDSPTWKKGVIMKVRAGEGSCVTVVRCFLCPPFDGPAPLRGGGVGSTDSVDQP